MKRIIRSFKIDNPELFKDKIFHWSKTFKTSVFLDSNKYEIRNGDFDTILAAGEVSSIPYTTKNSFKKLENFISKKNDWIFGYLSYDLKNEIEDLVSKNKTDFNLPNLFFFQAEKIWIIKSQTAEAHYIKDNDIENDWSSINSINQKKYFKKTKKILFQPRINKVDYLKKVRKILNHINRGDIYEVNFCMEWLAIKSEINPEIVFSKLNKLTKTPMSGFLKNNNFYLISSSPERFIKKKGNKVISQPIKGTAKRDSIKIKDLKIREKLKNDPKERAENIMIVDLVRNDLSKFSVPGSVKVTELCEVYPFKQVNQMISTVESDLSKNKKLIDILKSTFPMGSMTGAPKIEALKIIDDLEVSKREVYSGSLGYVDPNGDFDFNVVIRSILYDSKKRILSFQVGSAITSNSQPEKEFEECLLKASPMMSIFN